MPYYTPTSAWTHEFFLLRKKSANFIPDRRLIALYQKNGLEKNT